MTTPPRKKKWYSTRRGARRVNDLLKQKINKDSSAQALAIIQKVIQLGLPEEELLRRMRNLSTDKEIAKESARSKRLLIYKIGRLRMRAALKITLDRLGIHDPDFFRELDRSIFDSMRFSGAKKAEVLYQEALGKITIVLVAKKINEIRFLEKLREAMREVAGE